MQQSPWEANRFLASQEIPRILWNPRFHYRIYKFSLRVPNPVPDRSSPNSHIPLPKDPSYYYHLISVWVFQVVSLLSFLHQIPTYTYPVPIRATWPAHLIILDLITRIHVDTKLNEHTIQHLPTNWTISFVEAYT
jgi:hypothetical protein